MFDFIETSHMRQALGLAQALLTAECNRVGKIDGEPGTGKSTISKYLVQQLDAVRLCAYQGISTKALMMDLCEALGEESRPGTAAVQTARLKPLVNGRLVIVDEANHLKWQQMEGLRFLADEAGMALLLIGTDLMNRQFRTPQTGVFLAQLASRIGSKTLHLTRIRRLEELVGYMILPRFGNVDKQTAKRFQEITKGYWREGYELAQACQRLMEQQSIQQLTLDIVDAAAVWMADARTGSRGAE